jgi:gamma-glutamylcyclotransferase (GGCT)/AIG2-like uncharacterized protein YtfP
VVGDGVDTSTWGDLYDTGRGYPAAVFREPAEQGDSPSIAGRVYRLSDVSRALELLDEVESAVEGLYSRVVVRVAIGVDAWAYQCGDPALLHRRIAVGDWLQRNGPFRTG